MSATCVRCTRPMPDVAYACTHCANQAADQLHETADMTQAARDIAHGMARSGPGTSGSGEPRLPLNLGATQRLDAVQGHLTGWARHVMETRGIHGPGIHGDPVVRSARFLAGHVEWIRHRREADEFLDDVARCAGVLRGIVRGPASQKYLGPCGAPSWTESLGGESRCRELEGPPCAGDVYAYRGAKIGRCRTCDTGVATSERTAWLDGEVRSRAFLDSQIADAYEISVKTIRSWATERPEVRNSAGKLVRSATSARLRPHAHDLDGQPLYLVADVLDLAAADAARRESNRSRRSRAATAECAS